MRSKAFAALVLALAACNRGDDGEELARGTDELNAAQIEAALGPADQSMVEDIPAAEGEQNALSANAEVPANSAEPNPVNSAEGNQEEE